MRIMTESWFRVTPPKPVTRNHSGSQDVLPGCEFGVEGVDVGDASVGALAGQGREFDLGDVEPGTVSGLSSAGCST